MIDPTGHRLIIADDERGRPVVAPVTRPTTPPAASSPSTNPEQGNPGEPRVQDPKVKKENSLINENGGFNSADDAAYWFLLTYQGKSQEELREYGAIIYKKGTNYYIFDYFVGDRYGVGDLGISAIVASWGLNTRQICNGSAEFVGTVHTHPEEIGLTEGNSCRFSAGEIGATTWFGDNWLPGIRYLGSPNGVMYKSIDLGENEIVHDDLPIAPSSIAYGDQKKVYPNSVPVHIAPPAVDLSWIW